MADRETTTTGGACQTPRWRITGYLPSSSQILGLLTLLVSGAILVILTVLTVTGAVTGVVFIGPLIVVTSPIWVPAGALALVVAGGFLSTCGLGVAALAAAAWVYRYVTGRQPVGSERVDYARRRIAGAAGNVKDYGQRRRVKDVAAGA